MTGDDVSETENLHPENWRWESVLRELKQERGWSAREIADWADVPLALVHSYLEKHGLHDHEYAITPKDTLAAQLEEMSPDDV